MYQLTQQVAVTIETKDSVAQLQFCRITSSEFIHWTREYVKKSTSNI